MGVWLGFTLELFVIGLQGVLIRSLIRVQILSFDWCRFN